jgi:hypothetical protein
MVESVETGTLPGDYDSTDPIMYIMFHCPRLHPETPTGSASWNAGV